MDGILLGEYPKCKRDATNADTNDDINTLFLDNCTICVGPRMCYYTMEKYARLYSHSAIIDWVQKSSRTLLQNVIEFNKINTNITYIYYYFTNLDM